jgi:hypothetical protein
MKLETITTLLLVLLWLCPLTIICAQDSTETDEDEWEWDWESSEIHDWIFFGRKMPTISGFYGITNIKDKDIHQSLADGNLLQLDLGHTRRNTSRYAENILKYSYKNLYLGYVSSEFSGRNSDTSEIDSKTWRFGFARSSGYGYKMGSSALMFYNSWSWDWSKVDFTSRANNPIDQNTLDYIEDGVRFGTSADGGIRFAVTPLITLDVGYQRSIVFHRHLFWKWAGSAIIEAASQGILDYFIKEIFYASPSAGPIVYFLLKNALSYGIYELRQEKMNWPFSSAPPLSFDSFKFGVMFTF